MCFGRAAIIATTAGNVWTHTTKRRARNVGGYGSGRKPLKPEEQRVKIILITHPKTALRLRELSNQLGIAPGRVVDGLVNKENK
jgi:hypothetical protein